jgi:ketosteroid isomerase-like protein
VRIAAAGLLLFIAGCATSLAQPDRAALQRQVFDTERAFARTMADRDLGAFASLISDEAIFFSSTQALRGRPEIVERWKKFYEKSKAPFSWEPEKVEVLDSGTLALSTGPVHDPDGKLIGTFTSIWRQERPGQWRTVFDKGCDVCEACPPR